ncbi:MAG: Ni/Fe hydrogenase subunit alpha [Deltaproteobacteria bacterium]|nr:Ni/Fe hydrogenase subunit alpha [Deltaproteobacteria bacterium]
MKVKIKTQGNQITRVEGHGSLVLRFSGGKPSVVRWDITESPRFFEFMLKGRPWHDAHVLASRICGICSVSHQFASLAATEEAFGIHVSEQSILLRKLLYAGEIIESHMLHVYMLAIPDFFDAGSVFPLMETAKDVVMTGLRLKKLGNDIKELIGGRAIHPQTPMVGGFGRLPGKQTLLSLKNLLNEAIPDLLTTVELFRGLSISQFRRDTEYISLTHPDEYALIRGLLYSTETGSAKLDEYADIAIEYIVPHSTAKFARHVRESYAVGALSRININRKKLNPMAVQTADELGIGTICSNPFVNTMAQIVETVHEVEEAQDIVKKLLENGIAEEKLTVEPRAGRGIGAVEAPRGLLIHDYIYDSNGRIVSANCVIPTNQNHANIQYDLEELVRINSDKNEDDLRKLCEMLIRSYDPCISCSTH